MTTNETVEDEARERLRSFLRDPDSLPADPVARAVLLGQLSAAVDAVRTEISDRTQEAVVEVYRNTPGPTPGWPRSYDQTAKRLTEAGRKMTPQRIREIVANWERRTGERA